MDRRLCPIAWRLVRNRHNVGKLARFQTGQIRCWWYRGRSRRLELLLDGSRYEPALKTGVAISTIRRLEDLHRQIGAHFETVEKDEKGFRAGMSGVSRLPRARSENEELDACSLHSASFDFAVSGAAISEKGPLL